AAPRQVLASVAPNHLALFPRNAQDVGPGAMHIDRRVGTEVADAGLELHLPVRSDDQKPVEADGARREWADRHARSTHLGTGTLADPRFLLFPLEELRTFVQSFLHEGARDVRLLSARGRRAEWGLAGWSVDLSNLDLIDAKLPSSLCQDRLEDRVSLKSTGSSLGGLWRRIGQHAKAAPPHRSRLVSERDRPTRTTRVTLLLIGTVLADRDAIDRENFSVLAQTELHTPVNAGTCPADVVLF